MTAIAGKACASFPRDCSANPACAQRRSRALSGKRKSLARRQTNMFEFLKRSASARAGAPNKNTDLLLAGASARAGAPERKSAPLIALQLGHRARVWPRDYASLAREGVMQNAV